MDGSRHSRSFLQRALAVHSRTADYHMKCPKTIRLYLLQIFLFSTAAALAASSGPPFANFISSPAESSTARFQSPVFSSVSITDAPRLTFTRKDGEIIVGWPLETPGWVLEQSS